jgi:hypothetical protein
VIITGTPAIQARKVGASQVATSVFASSQEPRPVMLAFTSASPRIVAAALASLTLRRDQRSSNSGSIVTLSEPSSAAVTSALQLNADVNACGAAAARAPAPDRSPASMWPSGMASTMLAGTVSTTVSPPSVRFETTRASMPCGVAGPTSRATYSPLATAALPR